MKPRSARVWKRALLACAIFAEVTTAQPAELRLGFLVPWESSENLGPYVTPAILRAVEAVNARDDVLNGTQLKWVWHDSRCDETSATAAWMDLILKYDVHAVIGPACSKPATRVASVSRFWNVPVISYAAEMVLFSFTADSDTNFVRVNSAPSNLLNAFPSLLGAKNWTSHAIFVTFDLEWAPLVSFLSLVDLGSNAVLTPVAPTTVINAGHTLNIMSDFRATGIRAAAIVGSCVDMRAILLAAKRLEMLEGYSYLLLDVKEDCHVVEDDGWPEGWGPEANSEAAEAFNNTLSVHAPFYSSSTRAAFDAQLQADFATQRFAPFRVPPAGDIAPSEAVVRNPLNLSYEIDVPQGYDTTALNVAANLFDAVALYAMGADAVIQAGADPTQYQNIVQAMSRRLLFGMTGPVYLAGNDRLSGALFQNVFIRSDGGLGFRNVATFDPLFNSFTELAPIVYPGGVRTTPASFVPNPCNISDYEVETESCNSDGNVELIFTVKDGAVCSDVSRPEASAECAYVSENTVFGRATLACASVGTVVCLAFLVWICTFREHDVLRLSQPELGGMCMLGCLMLNVSSFLTVGNEGRLACTVAPRMFHLSFTVAIGALIAKLFRVWRIFENHKLRKVRIRFRDMFVVVVFFVVLDIMFLALSAVLKPPHMRYQEETTDGAHIQIEQLRCVDAGVFTFLLWGTKFALLIGTSILAYATRYLSEYFAETRDILTCVYQIAWLTSVAVVVTYMADSLLLDVFFRSLSIMLGTCGGLALIFVPKMKAIYEGVDTERALLETRTVTVTDGRGTAFAEEHQSAPELRRALQQNTALGSRRIAWSNSSERRSSLKAGVTESASRSRASPQCSNALDLADIPEGQ